MDLLIRAWTFVLSSAGKVVFRVVVAMAIVVVAIVVARLLAKAVDRVVHKSTAKTIGSAVRGLVRLVVIGTGLVMALDQVGVNVTTVLAGAGIAGLAVGFGAQALVKDVISGFFLIFDDVIAMGDTIKVGEAQGEVEAIGLRLTQVRGVDGQVWYIPNGQIAVVANANRGWSRAIVNLSVSGDHDVKHCMQLLQQVGEQYAKDHADMALSGPETQGILSLGADVGLRLTLRVKPTHAAEVERDLRMGIKTAFDAESIKVKT